MKDHRSRRAFMSLTGAGVGGFVGGPWLGARASAAAAAEGQDPDLVVFNAKVYTVDAARAAGRGVRGHRPAGSPPSARTADIKALAGKSTQTFDAKQMTIVPGFTDCHNHAGGDVLLYEVLVGNPVRGRVRHHRQHHRQAAREGPPDAAGHVGRRVLLRRHQGQGQARAERSRPRRGLARASGRRPASRRPHVVLQQQGARDGGRHQEHAESARRHLRPRRARRAQRTRDRSRAERVQQRRQRQTFTAEQSEQRGRDGLAHISKQFVRYGLTSVHHEGGDLSALQAVRARGELLHRVSYEASGKVLEAMIAGGIMTGFGDEWIRFGATSEHTVDGSFSERTMALSQPYPGIQPPYKGNVTETQDDLNAWIERVHRAGIQVNCHANGDVAIDMFLTAVERAQQAVPARRRAPEDHALHADQRRSGAAHQGARRRPGDVHDLRLLQHRQVRVLRRRSDEAEHGLPHVARRRRAGGGRLGLQPGPVRAADGHSGHGDAHGVERRDLGRQPADHRRRSAAGQHDQRRLRVARGGASRDRSRRESWRTSSSWPTTRTPWTRRRSRTSRSSARSWAAPRCTRHNDAHGTSRRPRRRRHWRDLRRRPRHRVRACPERGAGIRDRTLGGR